MGNRLYDADYLQLLSDVLSGLKQRSHFLLTVRPGERIGDVGCGTGEDAWRLAQAGADVIGVDVDEGFIEAARSKYAQSGLPLRFEIHDAYSIKHTDHSFDKLRYERVFQHLDNPQRAIAEAHRLLKPGGDIQIVDADYFSLSFLYPNVQVERKLIDHLVYERLPNSHKVRSIPKFLADVGFAITGVEIYPLVITDPNLVLKIIKFDEIVRRLVHVGTLDLQQGEALLAYFADHASPFNFSINELIFSARAELP
jgi:2-polyprenyl-3-methyl-5-hydroxy-6-metoxy-1,4-benzoquinol methylase